MKIYLMFYILHFMLFPKDSLVVLVYEEKYSFEEKLINNIHVIHVYIFCILI